MDGFVTAIEAEVTVAALWAVVAGLAGLIAVAVLFGFGNHKAGRVISGIGRGKARF